LSDLPSACKLRGKFPGALPQAQPHIWAPFQKWSWAPR
jgi:hypothetical protein